MKQDRRKILKALFATGSVVCLDGCHLNTLSMPTLRNPQTGNTEGLDPAELLHEPLHDPLLEDGLRTDTVLSEDMDMQQELTPGMQHMEEDVDVQGQGLITEEEEIARYLEKIRNFDADFIDDIYLDERGWRLIRPTLARLDRVQSYVGHGNFNLVGYEEMLFFARNYSEIGAFSQEEIDFLEEIFFTDASHYGFYGKKVTTAINNSIDSRSVYKVPGSGHYLLRGDSLARYEQLRRDIGDQMLLTSGVRNVVKQMHLFLAKTVQSNGNLSKASRSLAPPGYSFHGIGDFDVGKVGWGERNFTDAFSHTEEFKRLIRLGYVDIRYTDTNAFGVRYEPWHIKIA